MKFHRLHKWELSEAIEGLLFFAQRLDELLFDYSLDSYKPSALNAPFLCREALDLISDIEAELIDEPNLVHVLEELVWSIQNDKIAKTLLDVPLDHYVLQHDAPISQKKLRLEVLSKTLDPFRYLNQCRAFLRNAVIEKQKKDIDLYTKNLITCLINIGVSKAFLAKKAKEFFFSGPTPSINKIEVLDDFFSEIEPKKHGFDVYFIVSKDIAIVEKSIRTFGIETLEHLPEALITFAQSHGFNASGSDVLVKLGEIREFDEFSARTKAEGRIDTLKDLFTLFFHRNQLEWKTSALIVQKCCSEVKAIVGRSKSSMEKAFDMHPTRASKELNWMLGNLSLRFGGSFDKFKRIVDLHGICVTNEVQENQLLNIWISLETLVPSHSGKNKITNIINSLDPFLRLTYLKRLVDRALADLFFWDSNITRKIIRKVKGANSHKAAIRLLHLLVLEENQPLRAELYTSLKDFHLLRFRIFTLAEAFKNPSSVKTLLDSHSRKTAWQLRRLYRTRNLLVHAGRTPAYLPTLIENGHDYLDLVLNEVMNHSCGDYSISTLEQAFELEKLLQERFDKSIGSILKFDQDNVQILYHDAMTSFNLN